MSAVTEDPFESENDFMPQPDERFMMVGRDEKDDSAVLQAIADEHNRDDQLKQLRPISVRRNSLLRDAMTYGGAAFACCSVLVSIGMAYSSLCSDIETNTTTATEVKAVQGTHTEDIADIKVRVEKIDTRQQDLKEHLGKRMDRQDAVLDRILQKIDN